MKVLWALVVLMLAAAPAFACPQCALNDKAGLGSWFILGGMIMFPFAVVGGALYTFRKIGLLERVEDEPS